mmetsp:Transcript_25683/g.62409  ORF Transcript_25683/g.62409 Transcript_25683/m.62409 type:complete len:201 (-) Transcript_25683:108-710(-)
MKHTWINDARYVARSPPCTVYTVTMRGRAIATPVRLTPVSALIVTAPPMVSMALTMTLVSRQKQMKQMCAGFPHRDSTISQMVCAPGAVRLTCRESTEKRISCTAAPAAYQKGPATPNWYATLELCTRVATHVHCETRTLAVKPGPMRRLADAKLSAVTFWRLPVSKRIVQCMSIVVMIASRPPNPSTMAQALPSSSTSE